MSASVTKYRQDYRHPDYSVRQVHLTFQLTPGVTTVTAVSRIVRNGNKTSECRLDGAKFELVSLSRDGTHLVEGIDFIRDTEGVTLKNCPEEFSLETVTRLKPEDNNSGEGLYSSDGTYCTQCEPESFRQITYFVDRPDVMATYTVRIEGDKTTCPVLLSNGNLIESGDLPDNRHYAVWHDPFPKPSYLFALVAGDLGVLKDTFVTKSGRSVDLAIYVNHGNESRCAYAMDVLKRSMKWDEEAYGLEYDLNIYNIVAVNNFNSGAMENKSLNIFNASVVLAAPETETDINYMNVERVISHEYFHNWSGNRVTLRDWFQLTLKEGFTVLRDQQFSENADPSGTPTVRRAGTLRLRQFGEDAGPTAHPIRPDSYIKMDNFFTTTVYEKGAEVIRMVHTLIGSENFRAGSDLYFRRHDGQAVTCDDFLDCMQEASGVDLSHFKLWYSQSGTPTLDVTHSYDPSARQLRLTIKQETLPTADQSEKKPLHIPVAVGLVSKRDGRDLLPETTRILEVRAAEQTFVFDDITEPCIPSVLRAFSAPVKVNSDLTNEDLFFLLSHDSDSFVRWDSGQLALQRLLLNKIQSKDAGFADLPEAISHAFSRLIADRSDNSALIAEALSLPTRLYLAQESPSIDVDKICQCRDSLEAALAKKFKSALLALYRDSDLGDTPYAPSARQMGKRALRGKALHYLHTADASLAEQLASEQYKKATNMTDRLQALSVLANAGGTRAQEAFADFYAFAKGDPLMLNKWFALQAGADRSDTVEVVKTLLQHPDFTLKTPNRVAAVVGTFSANFAHFHRIDGAGYQLVADVVIALDSGNPQTAARLVSPLQHWQRYDKMRGELMRTQLKRILLVKNLSPNVYEIVSKSLAKPPKTETNPKP